MKKAAAVLILCVLLLSCGRKPDETVQTYYDSGKIKTEEQRLKGKKHGILKAWYENGALYLKQSVKNGKPDGEIIMYHSDGSVQMKGMMKKGKRNGKFEYYDKNGKLINTETWKNNRLIK